jgi:hypothetical protein
MVDLDAGGGQRLAEVEGLAGVQGVVREQRCPVLSSAA